MNATTPAQLKKVQITSALLRRFFMVLFVLTTVALLGSVIASVTIAPPAGVIRIAGVEFVGDAINGKIRLLGWLWIASGAAVALKILSHLIKLFGLYADGKIFTQKNVSEIRQLGITALLLPAVWLLLLITAAPEIAGRPDQWNEIVGSFPAHELFGGALVIVVSWIMDVGRELREEHELVI